MIGNRETLSEKDLDIVGSCFGLKFVARDASPDGLVELYIEDDENWFYKCTFNHFYLNDLERVIIEAKKYYRMK